MSQEATELLERLKIAAKRAMGAQKLEEYRPQQDWGSEHHTNGI